MKRKELKKPIISVEEARKILGKGADNMSENDIEYVIDTLDLLARDTLEQTKHKMLMRRDSMALANLLYDIYKKKKRDNVLGSDM